MCSDLDHIPRSTNEEYTDLQWESVENFENREQLLCTNHNVVHKSIYKKRTIMYNNRIDRAIIIN